jgi:hypothetical protein
LTAQGRALGGRIALAATLIVVVAAVLLESGVASTSSGRRQQRLHGASFTSSIDARWTVVARKSSHGSETLALSSTAAGLDSEGIPPAGAIGITIIESPSLALRLGAHLGPRRAVQEVQPTSGGTRAEQAIALMSRVVRAPASAQGVVHSGLPRFRTLSGASAAEESYEYVYGGRGNTQVDVVARHAGEIYFIELDTELAWIAQGEASFSRLLHDWRWR